MWKTIKGYEGYYEVSDSGEVRSLDRIVPDSKTGTRFVKGVTLRQAESVSRNKDDQGYMVVNLRKFSNADVRCVHRLVAEAFLENSRNLPTVNHIDGNKHNNNVSNLEWASYSDNNKHAITHNLRKPRGNKIAQIDFCGNIVNYFKSTCDAARKTGLSRGGISHCINGRTKTSGGFVWRKLSESQTTISKESTPGDELPAEAQRPSI